MMNSKIMQGFNIRFFYALLVALFVATSAVGPAYAQTAPSPTYSDVRLFMQDGFNARGRHAIADDIVLVCPTQEVLDPSHPCSNSGSSGFNRFDEEVLACPIKEVLDPSHPCAESNRRAQVIEATADDLVLVCPVKEVLDPNHPCAESNIGKAKFRIPNDYVLTCPVKEVLDPKHPCAE